jgi:hypothetical protein
MRSEKDIREDIRILEWFKNQLDDDDEMRVRIDVKIRTLKLVLEE